MDRRFSLWARIGLLAPLAWLLSAGPAAASGAQFRLALDAIVAHLQDPANCAVGAPCAKPFASAVRTLLGVNALLDQGKLDQAIQRTTNPIAQLVRAGLVSARGGLEPLVRALVDAAEACVTPLEAGLGGKLDGLCSSQQAPIETSKTRADTSLAAARVLHDAGQWSPALKEYAKLVKSYADLGKRADGAQPRCRPRACTTSDFVDFQAGAGECRTLVAPDKGTELCYHVVEPDVDGSFCFDYTGLDRGAFACSIVFEGSACTCNGNFSTSSCTDSEGWIRVSQVNQSLSLRCPDLGPGTARGSASLRLAPPSVSFFGALLPVPPAALELCVGDQMLEDAVALVGQFFGSRVTGECASTHRVVALEMVDVPAGVIPAVRIESDDVCETIQEGQAVTDTSTVTTWVASRIGFVRLTASFGDGGSTEFELTSYSLP